MYKEIDKRFALEVVEHIILAEGTMFQNIRGNFEGPEAGDQQGEKGKNLSCLRTHR
ncbi:hypothetical protein [Gramella sp. AN32]|uniref:Uncharacterized protein n=1 Tax=Christiangramia antarctica TaxID=2058158 RepID=A0ABW5X3R7_9FLAO|nr:hypothetical protein [Gramella sp. AN32]